jgi:hypothetical protein
VSRFSFSAANTHWLLSDVMNHCQEFHPELETGPASQLGSANYFRWVLGSHVCLFPDLVRGLIITGDWIKEDETLGKAVVTFYPRSDSVATETEPGIMLMKLPGQDVGGPNPLD